jgi:hypothetical protein
MKDVKKLVILGITLVLLLACVGAVSANLVSNPSFESPINSQSWQWYPDGTATLEWHVEQGLGAPAGTPLLEYQTLSTIGLTPADGNQYAELDSDANVNISQMISVNAGKTYQISFAQACRSDGGENPSLLGVYWGDNYLGQTSCTQTKTWITHSYSPTASSTGQVKLMFVDEGPSNSYGVLLDNVVVTEENNVPIPEFPAVALLAALIVGFIGAVFFIKITKEN